MSGEWQPAWWINGEIFLISKEKDFDEACELILELARQGIDPAIVKMSVEL